MVNDGLQVRKEQGMSLRWGSSLTKIEFQVRETTKDADDDVDTCRYTRLRPVTLDSPSEDV